MAKKTKKQTAVSSLRIIGGQWRGRKLSFSSAEGLRPSGDRVRERVFNWLMHEVDNAECLDLFAGSGALGLEALSRGALQVSFVESNKATAKQITTSLETLLVDKTKASVFQGEAEQYLKHCDANKAFDIIFLDPPFGKNLLPPTLNQIISQSRLKANGLLYIELENQETALKALPDTIEIIKEKRSGQVCSLLAQVKEQVDLTL